MCQKCPLLKSCNKQPNYVCNYVCIYCNQLKTNVNSPIWDYPSVNYMLPLVWLCIGQYMCTLYMVLSLHEWYEQVIFIQGGDTGCRWVIHYCSHVLEILMGACEFLFKDTFVPDIKWNILGSGVVPKHKFFTEYAGFPQKENVLWNLLNFLTPSFANNKD